MASMQDAGFFCIPSSKLPSHERIIYCGLCMASAALGFLGATWQIYQWKPLTRGYKHRRKPSPNPMIVLSLALADLLACSGVIARSTAMMLTDPPRYNHTTESFTPLHSDKTFAIIGFSIEGLSQYFYGATFMWTVMYAVDTYIQLCNRTLPSFAYHLTCWGVPLLTTAASLLPLLVGHDMLVSCATGYRLIIRYIFYNILIILALIGDPALYILCNRLISKRMRESGLINSHNRAVMSALRRKFLSVILIFTICWLPNVVDFGIEITSAVSNHHPASLAKYFPLWAIEAVLNPLQGLLNCFVYGRHMLFRRIARNEGRITTDSEEIRESTPILNRRKTAEEYLDYQGL